MQYSRLTRNSLDRVLAGVCGGIGTYLGVSAWWVRLAWIVLTLTSWAFALCCYLLLWMLIPGQTFADLPPFESPFKPSSPRYARPEHMLILGALTILIGVTVLAQGAQLFQIRQGDVLLPIMIALIGFVLLIKHLRG